MGVLRGSLTNQPPIGLQLTQLESTGPLELKVEGATAYRSPVKQTIHTEQHVLPVQLLSKPLACQGQMSC